MTTHELAKKLLEGPDLPAMIRVGYPDFYGGMVVDLKEITMVLDSDKLSKSDKISNEVFSNTPRCIIIRTNEGWK